MKVAFLATLAALMMVPVLAIAQTGLTTEQAEEKAEALLGRKPSSVSRYLSKREKVNYLAFSHLTTGQWNETKNSGTPEREEVWIYTQRQDSNGVREVWHQSALWPDMQNWLSARYDLPAGFIELSARRSPCLRLKGYFGGMHAGTTRLGLYCVDERRLFWVDYFSDLGPSAETGLQKVRLTETNAADPQIRGYILSWGHKLGLDVPPTYPNVDAVRRIQQLWIDANGHKGCSLHWTPDSVTRWKSNQKDSLTPFAGPKLLNDPEISLDDGRYEWLSYRGADGMADVGREMAGVGEYDKKLGRFDLVYVPESTFDYSKRLVVIGEWLYIQDCDDHWAVRFSKVTHRLERGNFDDVIGNLATGVYPPGQSWQALCKEASELEDQYIAKVKAARESNCNKILTEPFGTDRSNVYIQCMRAADLSTDEWAGFIADFSERLQVELLQLRCLNWDHPGVDPYKCMEWAIDSDLQPSWSPRASIPYNDPHSEQNMIWRHDYPNGETGKITHECYVGLWQAKKERYKNEFSRPIRVSAGTDVVITDILGYGRRGKLLNGEYAGRAILVTDSELAFPP